MEIKFTAPRLLDGVEVSRHRRHTGSEWRVEITGSPATYECVCPPPPPVVCGDCDYCLKISNGDCKTGKSHDTQEKCEEKGDNYEWCGATPEPTVTPQPTVFADVCGECDVCLKISKDQCKTGGGHNTQPKCEGKGDNYVWCGPA